MAHEQGLAVVSCLQSGLVILCPTFPEQDRLLRVLRGFHGLHVYASDSWVEYLLSVAALEDGLDTSSKFYARSTQLSVHLNSVRQAEDPALDPKTLDSRLVHLESHSELFTAARSILAERAARAERELAVSSTLQAEPGLCEITDLPTLLSNYQHTVQALLQLWKFPDVGIQEFEKFKQDFRSTAFTCRFWTCPFASIGFENENLRDKHELTHAPRVSCDVPDCQYPPFPSTQALKNHQIKHHNQGMPSIKIRTPSDLQTRKAVPGSSERRRNEVGHQGTVRNRPDSNSDTEQNIPSSDIPRSQNNPPPKGLFNIPADHQLNIESGEDLTMKNPAFAHMVSCMKPEYRASLTAIPESKLRELLAKWTEHQVTTGRNPQQEVPRSGLTNPHQVSEAQATMQLPPWMDSTHVPQKILFHLEDKVPDDIREWGQLKAFVEGNSDFSSVFMDQLIGLQSLQFKNYVEGTQKMTEQQLRRTAGHSPVTQQTQSQTPQLSPHSHPMLSPKTSTRPSPHPQPYLDEQVLLAGTDEEHHTKLTPREDIRGGLEGGPKVDAEALPPRESVNPGIDANIGVQNFNR